ncbi:hypothetical protein D3C80_1777940 [compost metagenome]
MLGTRSAILGHSLKGAAIALGAEDGRLDIATVKLTDLGRAFTAFGPVMPNQHIFLAYPVAKRLHDAPRSLGFRHHQHDLAGHLGYILSRRPTIVFVELTEGGIQHQRGDSALKQAIIVGVLADLGELNEGGRKG